MKCLTFLLALVCSSAVAEDATLRFPFKSILISGVREVTFQQVCLKGVAYWYRQNGGTANYATETLAPAYAPGAGRPMTCQEASIENNN